MILTKHADKFDAEVIGKFNVIRENIRMMGQLIDDLLAFSRLGRTELSIDNAGHRGTDQGSVGGSQGHQPGSSPDAEDRGAPPGRGDRVLIKQVLVNILSNAVKFTKGTEEALIEAGGYNKDGEIVYYIRDNGIGFDMQYHDKLLGVFQRLHGADEFEGTGVGLAIVQRIIHRHGGRVWAEGEKDKGATFYFSLSSDMKEAHDKRSSRSRFYNTRLFGRTFLTADAQQTQTISIDNLQQTSRSRVIC